MRNVNQFFFKSFQFKFLIAIVCLSINTLFSQTTLIDPVGDGGFETGNTFALNNWTAVNSTTDRWVTNAPTTSTTGSFDGARCAFVSTSAAGTTIVYSQTSVIQHLYYTVTVPSTGNLTLNFKYIAGGEGTQFTDDWDNLKVFFVPSTAPTTDYTPVANTAVNNNFRIGNTFYNLTGATWTTPTQIALTGVCSGNYRLIFSWKSDVSTIANPSASLDNVNLIHTAAAQRITSSGGTFTIDNALANSGTNFTTFSEAITALNNVCGGLSSAVTFNVTAGQTFTENPPALTATGTMVNPIIFQKSGAGANPVLIDILGANTSTDFGFCISGGDYITFDGIDVNSSTATTSTLNLEFGYLIRNASATNGAQNNTIKNCAITLNKSFVGTSSSGCIYSSVSTSQGGFVPTNATGANSNNKFYNLTLTNAQNGVFLVGNSGFPDLNNEIGVTGSGCQATRNTINNMGGVTTFTAAYGIRCDGQSGVKIFNNDISNIRSNQSTTAGILLITFAGTNEIYNNKVSDVSNSGSTTSTSRAVGIELQNSSGTHTARVYNNVIFDIKSPYTSTATASRYAIGIFANNTVSATNAEIDNNSVYLSVASGIPTYSSTCFEIANSGTAVHKVRGNIFVNAFPAQGTTAKHFCWVSTAAAAIGGAGTVSNHNDLFILNDQSTSGHVGRGSTTNYNTLANWQAIAALPDANSISTNPLFTSATDLHSSASALNAFSGYTPQAWITTDIDCADRSTASPSDLGAYVINTCSVADGGTITPDTQNKCVGQTATMTSTGATIGSGITYQWKISLTSGSGYINVTGGSGATSTSYTSDALTAGTYYYVLETTCSAGPTTDLSNELTVTVNALPTVTVSPSSGSLCQPGASPITLTSDGASTYAWSPATGLSATTGAMVDASPSTTTVYTVTGTDGNGCTNTAMATVTVAGVVSTSASATPSTICSGENSQLLATGLQSFTTPSPSAYSFSGATGAYAAITGTTLSPGTTDDNGVGNLPIGFTFNYNGTNHTVFGMRTNGLIELSQTTVALSGFSANALASNANCIAPIWDDNNMVGGTMIYSTTGSPGSRILTAQWTGMHVGGSGSTTNPTINVQVKLYETSNKIEFIYGSTSAALSGTTASIGISGALGNFLSVTPLSPVNTSTTSSVTENSSISSATNFPSGTVYTFTPTGAPVFSYSWSPATFLSATNISNPLATAVTSSQTYTVTVTGNGGCSHTASVDVNVSSGASITAEPVSDSKCVGQTATFTVGATGPSLTYQWRKGGVDIPIGGNASAGTNTLSLTNVMVGDAAVYDVIVTSTCGSPAMSNGTSTLVVNTLPTVTVSPSTGTICNPGGSPVTLTASGGVSYAWNNTGSLTPTSGSPVSAAPSSTTTYTVTGTDSNGCTNTAMATVTVADAVSATASATPTLVCSGGNSQLDVVAIQGGGQSVIGAGASTSSSTAQSFFPGSWGGAKTQYIVLGSELIAQGLKAGNITALAFEPTTAGQTYQGFFVSIGTTAQTAMTTSFITTGLTEVYAGTLANNGLLPVANTVNTLTFGTGGTSPSFNWNGSSNIVISISWSSVPNASTSTASTMKVDAPGFTCSAYDQQDNVSPATMKASTTADGTGTSRPRFTFTGNKLVASPTYTWSESPAGSTLSSTNIVNPMANGISGSTTYSVTVTGNGGCSNIASVDVSVSSGASITAEPVSDSKCAGQTATFTVVATGPSLSYQWRKGGVDIPIIGNASAGTPTLSLTNVMAGDADTYDVVVTSTCGSPVMSNGTSALIVNAIPTASASNDGPKCVGSELNLSGTHSGGDTFTWTGPASYSASTQNAVRSGLTMAHSGTYTFTTTSTAGCTSDPATTSVIVNASPSAISIAPPGPVVLCPTSPAELLTAIGGTTKSSVTLNSGTLNLTIPDDTPTGVSNALTVSGIPMGATIDSIIAILNISHTFDGDLTLTLQGPNTNIEILSDQRGGSGDNFTNTRFTSDTSKPSITTGTPPFNGTFSAEGLLGNLFSVINGNWTLKAIDVDAGATGTLNNWSLTVYFSIPTSITWAPTTGLYTDAAATMVYTGTSTNMVYAKPASTETFTATASTEAQFTLDGNIIESGWGAALATSAGGPTPGFGAGHEINALYVQGGDKNINFGIASNVQDGNRILLFIDSKSGGYNDGSFGRAGAPQGIDDFNSGTTFDAGFNADYCLVIGTNAGSTNYFFDLYTLSAGGGPATYLGDVSDPKIGADPLNASNTRGFEIAILKTMLGYTGGELKVFAMYTSDGGFLSNQFLTRAGNADGNYGSGAVTFGSAMPDPVTVSLTNLQNYCISTGTVTVGIEGTIVKNTGNAGLNTLRSVYGCIAEGGTITYDQPTTVTTVLTAPLDFTKSVTIQGLDINNRPEITLTAAGSGISTGKILTLRNVDIKSPNTTFTGDGEVKVDDNTLTVIKQ